MRENECLGLRAQNARVDGSGCAPLRAPDSLLRKGHTCKSGLHTSGDGLRGRETGWTTVAVADSSSCLRQLWELGFERTGRWSAGRTKSLRTPHRHPEKTHSHHRRCCNDRTHAPGEERTFWRKCGVSPGL